MIRLKTWLWASLIVMPLFWSCKSDQEKCAFIPDHSNIVVHVEFEHYEDSIPNFKSKQHLIDFLTRNPLMREHFFRRKEYQDDSLFIRKLYAAFSHPAFDTLLMETRKIFKNTNDLER